MKTLVFLLSIVACDGTKSDTSSAATLQYYSTCGDPACEGYNGPTDGLAVCADETEGEECSEDGLQCDLEDNCNRRLICTDQDPATECPVSKAKHKRDIVYLDAEKAKTVSSQLQGMKIAEWHYITDSPNRKAHLGFLIDDNPGSPAVRPNGEQVDLYGYTSMAVVAIQQQQAQIERLERRIQELEQRLNETH